MNTMLSRTNTEYSIETEYSKESESKEDFESITSDGKGRPSKKPWIWRLNPFRADEMPPVPESDAGLVPEMTACWFSKLTWAWMSPLMMVFKLCTFLPI